MIAKQRALSLIEVTVVLAVVTLIGAAGAGMSARMAEEARTAKCQSNLKRQITAILEYTADYDGVLPGPVHPTIKRHVFDMSGSNSDADRRKSLAWLLRAVLPPVGPADTDPGLPDTQADEVFRCPTAEMIAPDQAFFDVANSQTSCWRERPYNYVCNSWGLTGIPFGSTISLSSASWTHTDPPHYFGAWYYCDSSPTLHSGKISWCPKRLDAIANHAAEWATADGWFRRLTDTYAVRPGMPILRAYTGTFTYDISESASLPSIPSAPYHRVSPSVARSHRELKTARLPWVDFAGETNMAYFDGHVAPLKSNWRVVGDAGTVNPYWSTFGGSHPLPGVWQPDETCTGSQ